MFRHFSDASAVPLKTAADCDGRYLADYGSEGWEFESLRARSLSAERSAAPIATRPSVDTFRRHFPAGVPVQGVSDVWRSLVWRCRQCASVVASWCGVTSNRVGPPPEISTRLVVDCAKSPTAGINLGWLTLQPDRGWGRELGNVSEGNCGRSCDGRRAGVQRRWTGCWHRERGTSRARRRGNSVAARSRPRRWGLLGPWRRSRLGRPWRLGLRRKLRLRARVGLHHRSVWAHHLVPLVADRARSSRPATRSSGGGPNQ